MLHLIMASHPDEAEAGPSGLAIEEMIRFARPRDIRL